MGEDGEWIVGNGDAEGIEACNLADIATDGRRPLDLDAAGDNAARRLRDHAGQRLAHASSGAQHGQFHLTHCLVRQAMRRRR